MCVISVKDIYIYNHRHKLTAMLSNKFKKHFPTFGTSFEPQVNLYFKPIFPISTHTPPTSPTSLGDRGKSGILGGKAYVSDIWPLKNLGEFP